MLATAENVVARFRKENGYTECQGHPHVGLNHTKYGVAYGMDGYAWCAMVIYWLLVIIFKVEHIRSAYTPTVFEWYRQRGRTFTDIAEFDLGDLIFFRNSERICHIGMCEAKPYKVNGVWVVPTIEGNTSSGDAGSQNDGGGVHDRKRSSVSGFWIAGGAKPFYKDAPKKVALDFPVRDYLKRGDDGPDVKNWQRDLNGYFKAKGFEKPLEVTGVFDARTLEVTKQFQHEKGLDVDGRVGQHTIEKMEKIRDRQRKRDK